MIYDFFVSVLLQLTNNILVSLPDFPAIFFENVDFLIIADTLSQIISILCFVLPVPLVLSLAAFNTALVHSQSIDSAISKFKGFLPFFGD